MNNVLEKQRSAHEDIERLEQAIVDQYMEDPKTHLEKLYNEHIVDKFLTRIADKSEYLSQLYEDKDGLRHSEMEALSGSSEFTEFYERLQVLKEHHRKYPNEPVDSPEMEFIRTSTRKEDTDYEELEKLFSGEESIGRYLDLNTIHTMYNNLKGCKKMDYLQYLSEFDDFEKYPKAIKTTEDYKQYVSQLYEYLHSFFRRSKPLYDIKSLEEEALVEFNLQWEKGQVKGWMIDTSNQDLFCAACQKQFSKQTVYDAHLTAKKHIKAQKKLNEQENQATNGSTVDQVVGVKDDKRKAIAWKERLVTKYAEALADFREETKSNVERKQALTDKERSMEQEQEKVEYLDQDSDDDDEEKIYNPLNLPLGWDGKPIPYWLYKLHGLGVEYPCEICGNFSYMGRKAFDKHFQEWKHAQGMRSLGVPNTRQFHEITKIDDVLALYHKQSKDNNAEAKADIIEEYEDGEGNVYNKKTYEDLKRQGIL